MADMRFNARVLLSLRRRGPDDATIWAARVTQTPAAHAGAATVCHSIEFFEANVRPRVRRVLFHVPHEGRSGGLRVDSREALLKGGDSGPAIVPGNPDESICYRRFATPPNAPKMPMNGAKLSDAHIAALTQWIRDGAPWPASSGAAAPAMATSREKVDHRRAARVLVVSAAAPASTRPAVSAQRLGEIRHRSVHPRAAREGRPHARATRPTS